MVVWESSSSANYLDSRSLLYSGLYFCAQKFITTRLKHKIRLSRAPEGSKQVQTTGCCWSGAKSETLTPSSVCPLGSTVIMSASSSSSLRDMYAPSQASWSFVSPQSNNTLPSAIASNVPQTSYEWSTRSPTNPIFDLSSSLSLTEPSGVEIKLLLKGLIAGAVLQYTSTALAMPFEVGKLLLQVQWVPRDLSLLEGPTVKEEEYEEEAEVTSSHFISEMGCS